ncbi:MAG: hypothetical protein IH921_11355 [Gemmatimonadetes bacterium]|nr:hypothetical protein [Gemmatimonadota bacterium]
MKTYSVDQSRLWGTSVLSSAVRLVALLLAAGALVGAGSGEQLDKADYVAQVDDLREIAKARLAPDSEDPGVVRQRSRGKLTCRERIELLFDLRYELGGRNGRDTALVEEGEKEAVRVTYTRMGHTTIEEAVQPKRVGKRESGSVPPGRGLEEDPHDRLTHDLEFFNDITRGQTPLGTERPIEFRCPLPNGVHHGSPVIKSPRDHAREQVEKPFENTLHFLIHTDPAQDFLEPVTREKSSLDLEPISEVTRV